MEEPINDDAAAEAEIDKILDADIATLRAEQPLAPQAKAAADKPAEAATETKVEPKAEADKTADPTSPDPAAAAPAAEAPKDPVAEGFKKPVKGPTESEETYAKRVELAEFVDARKKAKSPEEKQRLSQAITETRQEMKVISTSKENITNKNGDAPVLQKTEDQLKREVQITKDKEYLKELGVLTPADLEKMRFDENVKTTLDSFVARHPEFKDEDVRDVFFDFVDSNYAWQSKTGAPLMTVLELAREAMYKPSETISERVLSGANVAEKVNAMQFPGGTVVKPALSGDQKKSLDELMATGMTESKAMALISEDE